MRNLFVLVTLTLCMSIPSFAGDVVGHSAKAEGKDNYRAAKISAKDAGKAGKAVVKLLF